MTNQACLITQSIVLFLLLLLLNQSSQLNSLTTATITNQNVEQESTSTAAIVSNSSLTTSSSPATQLRPTRLIKSPNQHPKNSTRRSKNNRQNKFNNTSTTNSDLEAPTPINQLISASQLSSLNSNTPPLFLPNLQNLFIDVGKPRTLLDWSALVQAHDQDGDKLTYSLRPSNWLHHDASKFMKINAQSGLLTISLNNSDTQQSDEFVHSSDDLEEADDQSSDQQKTLVDAISSEDSSTTLSSYNDTKEEAKLESIPSGIYFLNVVANDGHEDSIFEVKITVKNSSQLTSEQATMSNEELESKLHLRSGLFFEKLLQQQQFEQSDPSLRQTNVTALVYPEYANPSLVSQPDLLMPTAALQKSNTNDYRQNYVQIPPINTNHHHNNQHHNHHQNHHDNSMKHQQNRVKLEQINLKSQNQNHDQQQYENSRSIIPLGTLQTATLFRSDINPSSNNHHQFHNNLNHHHHQQQQQHHLDHHEQSSLTFTPPTKQQDHQQVPFMSMLNISSIIVVLLSLILFTFYLSHKWTMSRMKSSHHHHHHLSHPKDITSSSTLCSSSAFSMNHASSASSTSGSSSLAASSTGTNFPPLNKFMMDPSISYTIDSRYPTGPMQLSLNPQGRSIVGNYLQSGDLGYIRQHHQQPAHINTHTTNITNPAYLRQQQPQQALIINQFTMGQNQSNCSNLVTKQLTSHNNNSHLLGDEYVMHDTNDYATISPDFTTSLEHARNNQPQKQMSTNYNQSMKLTEHDNKKRNPFVCNHSRTIQSPGSRSSTSSTQAIADFLSLPGRQNHQKQSLSSSDQKVGTKANQSALDELMTLDLSHNTGSNNNLNRTDAIIIPAPRTIARGSHIARELNRPRSWEVERHRLKIGELLDEGQFGQVYRCLLDVPGRSWSSSNNNRSDNDNQLIVAVKTLKKSASSNERERDELLAEIEIMKLVCDHTNVVKILHCCTKDIVANENPIYLIMEYAELGKLKSFLEKSRESRQYCTSIPTSMDASSGLTFVPEDPDDSDHTYNLTSRDLIKFIYHVAKGMEYISSKSIVHRDLATRNILVSSGRICKIGDFGMARQMNPTDCGVYERKSPNTKVPVRWMAPEVLLKNCYTTKSDVFSFGILMWEIVTLASTPYWDLKTEQVIDAVARCRKRPEKPDYCHELLYDIMSKCWQHDAHCRPTFRELVKRLDNLVLSSNDYIELDQYPDHNYYNIKQTKAPYELL